MDACHNGVGAKDMYQLLMLIIGVAEVIKWVMLIEIG